MIQILVIFLKVSNYVVDLGYPDKMKKKTKNFPFCPEIKVIPKDRHDE